MKPIKKYNVIIKLKNGKEETVRDVVDPRFSENTIICELENHQFEVIPFTNINWITIIPQERNDNA